AKWFHSELFADIDPDKTFKQLHDRFLPIDYQPGYFGTLSN
ncbi:MAG: ABC transporter substrate-binding protein, partial [Thalassospira sp.]|nr:ABC transporter substrate-binding protein [Thalassospira sp.]